MHVFWVFLVASAFAVATCDDDAASPLDPKDMAAIQDKIAKYDVMEMFFKHLIGLGKSPEERDDKCLPIGAECHFWSGPNCCGLRTRCIIWDYLVHGNPRKGIPSKWLSRCQEYRLGVWLDDIGSWFSNLG